MARKMMKRNPWKVIGNAYDGCTIRINRWLVGHAKAICKDCGVRFKIDDSSIDYDDDTVLAIVGADDHESYVRAGIDMHNELGVDLSPLS